MFIRLSALSALHIAFVSIIPVTAHSYSQLIDGRSAGLAGMGVMLYGNESIFSNQAGLSRQQRKGVGMHYQNPFMLTQTGTKAVHCVIPSPSGVWAANLSYFGYAKYNITKTSLAFAKNLANTVSAGIQLNHHNMFIADDYGHSNKISAEAGLIASPAKNIFIGFHVFNPWQSMHQARHSELTATITKIGFAWKISDSYLLSEVITEQRKSTICIVGIEHCVTKNFFLRAGLSPNLSSYAFGIGYKTAGIHTNIAFMSQQPLGFTPHLSLSYAPEK